MIINKFVMKLPKQFVKNIKNINQDWLNNLEDLISFFETKWNLQNIKTHPNLSYHYVATAFSSLGKQEVILKICLPSHEFKYEQRALTFYNGINCVKLLEYDLENYGLLLEYLKPGTTLKTFFPGKDDESIKIFAQLIKQLHSKIINNFDDFPKLKDWLKIFDNFNDPKISVSAIHKAKKLTDELLNSQSDLYLLHGDLHQDNILHTSDSYKAIDPKGIIGELAFEVGAFIRNPDELLLQPGKEEIVNNRINKFSEFLNLDKKRIIKWCYVQSILSACWAIQDNTPDYNHWLKISELFKVDLMGN